MGLLYTEGGAIPIDYDEAERWFRAAAQAGDPEAQHALARMFEDGLGRPVNPVLAYVWSERAANNGSAAAAETRDRVAASMDEDQLGEARRLAIGR